MNPCTIVAIILVGVGEALNIEGFVKRNIDTQTFGVFLEMIGFALTVINQI